MTGAMRGRLAELRYQRELLVDRAAVQRSELAAVCAEFDGIIHWINRAAAVLSWLRARPGVSSVSMLSAGVVAIAVARRWIGRALMVYQAIKFLHERFIGPKTETSLAVRTDMEAT